MMVSQVVFLSRAYGLCCELSRGNYKWKGVLFGDNTYISNYVKYVEVISLFLLCNTLKHIALYSDWRRDS